MEGYDIILTNLRIKDVADTGGLFGSTQSPTVTVSINDQSFSTTRVRHGRTEANFTEEFVFHFLPTTTTEDHKVLISVFNESSKGVKTSIGNGEMHLREILKVSPPDSFPANGYENDFSLNLMHTMKNNKEHNKGRFSAHLRVQYRSSDSKPSLIPITEEGISLPITKSGKNDEGSPADKTNLKTSSATAGTVMDSSVKSAKPDVNSLNDGGRERTTYSGAGDPTSSEVISETKTVIVKEPTADVKEKISPTEADVTSTHAKNNATKNTESTIKETASDNQSLKKGFYVVLSKLSVTAMMPGQRDILRDGNMLSIQIGDEKKSIRVSEEIASQQMSFSSPSDPKDTKLIASLSSDIVARENIMHLFPVLGKPVAFTLYLSELKSQPLQQPSAQESGSVARLDGMGIVTYDQPLPVESKVKGMSIGAAKSGNDISGVTIPSAENDKNKLGDEPRNTISSAIASTRIVSDSPSVGATNQKYSEPVAPVTVTAIGVVPANTAVTATGGLPANDTATAAGVAANVAVTTTINDAATTTGVVANVAVTTSGPANETATSAGGFLANETTTAAVVLANIAVSPTGVDHANGTATTAGVATSGPANDTATSTAAVAITGATVADINPSKTSGAGLSSKSKRLIAEADGSIRRHRKAYIVTDPNVNATKIQALWRGKRIRRSLRRQNTAAIIIQRIVRGNLTRWTEGDYWTRAKVHKELKGESNARLRRIRQRERSLHMLRSLPAKDVGDLTRLEQQRAARTIQRVWRSGRDARIRNPVNRSSRSTKSTVRNPGYAFIVKKFAKMKDKGSLPELQGERISNEGIGSGEDVALTERKAKLQEYIHRNLIGDTAQPKPNPAKLSIDPGPTLNLVNENHEVYQSTHDYRAEGDAIKLAQLQRRIKEAASKKHATRDKQQDLDLNSTLGRGGGDEREGAKFGTRRKYQQMLEEQRKATILLQEHFAGAEEMAQRQILRHDTLGHCHYLVKQLTSPLSLDDAVEALHAIRQQPNNESDWPRRDYLGKYPVHETRKPGPDLVDGSLPLISPTYIDAHFQTVAALRRDRQGWGSVIVPYNDIYNNPEKGLGSDGMGSQANKMNSFLANVANVNVKLSKSIEASEDPFSSRPKSSRQPHDRLSADPHIRNSADQVQNEHNGARGGSDLEDSLYWISYATQPSHVKPAVFNNDQESVLRGTDRDGLRRGDRADADPNQFLLNKLNPTQEQRQLQYAALRTQISTEVVSASLRKDRIKQQCADDYNKINRLASLYQNEILNILEKENRVRAQQDMTEQEKQARLNAAVRIQAAIRGKNSRIRTASLKAQRRVISALQVLLKEIGYAENTQQRKESRHAPSYNPTTMDPNIILSSIHRNLVDNKSVYNSTEKQQHINRRSKEKAPQTAFLPTQTSQTPRKSVHYDSISLLLGSHGGTEKLGHLPVVRNLAFSPSSSKGKLAEDFFHSNEGHQNILGAPESEHSFSNQVPSTSVSLSQDQPYTLSPRNRGQVSPIPVRNPNTEFFSPDAQPTLAESNSNLLDSGGSANLSVYSPAQGEFAGYISSPSQSHNTLASSLSHSGAHPFPNPNSNPNLTATQSTNNQSSKKSLLAREPTLKEADNENDSDSESPHQKRTLHSPMSSPGRPNSSIEQARVALMSVPAGSGWQGKQQEDQVKQTMEKVEDLYRRNNCSVETYLPSALIADIARFNKEASYKILDNLVMVCGVHLIGQFLQRFVRDSSSSPDARSTSSPALTPNSNSSSTMIIIMGEVEVETAAMVLAQLSTELGVLSLLFSSDRPEGDYADMTLTESVTQLCIWLRLLGSGSSSGLVSVAEVISLLEDRWMKGVNLPHDAERAMYEIGLCRYRLMLKATRISVNSAKVLDDAMESVMEDNRRRGNRTKADILTIADIQSIIGTWVSSERVTLTSELAAAIGRLCQTNANPTFISITATQLKFFLCRLCSFRALQLRIQVWFRAVPTMYLSLLQMLHSMHPNLSASPSPHTNRQAKKSTIVSSSVFIRACQQSELPLCMAEIIMLAELLSRRRNADVSRSSSSIKQEGNEAHDMVDISLLNQIKKGELLNAPLS